MSQLVKPHGSETLNILLLEGAERESALAAAEFSRRPLSELAGSRVLVVTLVAFGSYNLYRLAVASLAGMPSALWQHTASAQVTMRRRERSRRRKVMGCSRSVSPTWP